MKMWLYFGTAVQSSRRLVMLLLLNELQQHCLLACVPWKLPMSRSSLAVALTLMASGLLYEIVYSKQRVGRCSGKAKEWMAGLALCSSPPHYYYYTRHNQCKQYEDN